MHHNIGLELREEHGEIKRAFHVASLAARVWRHPAWQSTMVVATTAEPLGMIGS